MIIDASSLIIFAKINKLELLSKLFGTLIITDEIYKETVEEGLIINAPDAKIIKKAIEDNKIKLISLNNKYSNLCKELKETFSQLDIGESEVIALALQNKEKAIIIDEKLGRKVCKLYKIKPIGTLRIILESYKKGIIKEQEVKETINELVKNDFRIGADVMNEFWIIFDRIKKKRD